MVLLLYVTKHKCHYMKVPLKGLHWNVYSTGFCLQTQMLVRIRRNLCLLCTLVTSVINCLNMEGLPFYRNIATSEQMLTGLFPNFSVLTKLLVVFFFMMHLKFRAKWRFFKAKLSQVCRFWARCVQSSRGVFWWRRKMSTSSKANATSLQENSW